MRAQSNLANHLAPIEIAPIESAACSERALTIFTQDRVSLHTGRVCGVEVLVRPVAYAGGAEAYYAALRVAPWDIRMGMEDQSAQAAISAAKHIAVDSVSINLSWPYLFSRYGEKALQALRQVVSKKSITVEVLEYDPVDYREAAGMVASLKRQGFRVAIDDFGKGYADEVLISRINGIDEVKFDGTLIGSMPQSRLAELVSMVHDIGAIATAEWVETWAQHAMVKAAAFDVGQGYYLGKPKPFDWFV